ncbi:ciliogenesis-associated TTC17-interacting protein isoform X3 [Zonotrichia leucophrys gambelii]|uniref:ciliogenesis-associated TTC17-interacting protein isoform X3 n=1 Tax=Zonotrichia leucophrys gambelii TaxID=257770 RepID=UPI0031405F58
MEPPPERPWDSPSVADTAAEFLSLIGLKELEGCLFAERLAVVAVGASPRDKAQGQWWMAAQWAPYQQEGAPMQSCILVQTRFRSKHNGVPVSSSLKAYLTWQLETLEQEEQECLELTPHPTEKRTHFVSHEYGMTVTRTLQEGGAEPQCHSFSYGRARLRARLLEGASLLLLRVLARRQTMPPGLVFPAINSEGDLCTFSYSTLGIQRQAVGSAETEVFVIRRAVRASTGAPSVWHSSFLPSGHLAQLMQIGAPVLMLLQDESILSKSGRFAPQLPFPKEPLEWDEDMELYSYFLDRKALLHQQPDDTISFAAEFFAHQRPVGSPFASTGAASPLPSSPAGPPPANSK